MGEPCANPYLNIAAQLSAGLDGLAGAAAGSGDGPGDGPGQVVPQSLREALGAFTAGRAGHLLGAPLAACLAKLKESELRRFEGWCAQAAPVPGRVTEWSSASTSGRTERRRNRARCGRGRASHRTGSPVLSLNQPPDEGRR